MPHKYGKKQIKVKRSVDFEIDNYEKIKNYQNKMKFSASSKVINILINSTMDYSERTRELLSYSILNNFLILLDQMDEYGEFEKKNITNDLHKLSSLYSILNYGKDMFDKRDTIQLFHMRKIEMKEYFAIIPNDWVVIDYPIAIKSDEMYACEFYERNLPHFVFFKNKTDVLDDKTKEKIVKRILAMNDTFANMCNEEYIKTCSKVPLPIFTKIVDAPIHPCGAVLIKKKVEEN